MSWLAVWLIALGSADLARTSNRPGSGRRAVYVGCGVLAGVGVLAGLTTPADVLALAASAIPLAAWVRYTSRTIRHGRAPTMALVFLGGAVFGMLALSGFASPVGGLLSHWLAWADLPVVGGHTPDRILLITGLLLVNMATGNVIVQLMLVTMGAARPTETHSDAPEPSQQIRGGRLLGPLERLFIFGLGLTGEVTAASIVIAAKGLLRYPELQSSASRPVRSADGNLGNVSEYFLVGSFVSWLVALVSLAMTL